MEGSELGLYKSVSTDEEKGQVCVLLLLISAVNDIYWTLGRVFFSCICNYIQLFYFRNGNRKRPLQDKAKPKRGEI